MLNCMSHQHLLICLVFFKKVVKPDTMLNSLRNESEEIFYGDLTETRKVHNDGSAVKTLFVGSILRGHRRKAERFGKRNLMHSSQAAWCHLTGIERVITQHSDLQHQDLHRVFSRVPGMNSSINSSGRMF